MIKKSRSARRRERRLRFATIIAGIFIVAALALVARYLFAPKGDDFFNAAEQARAKSDFKAAVINYKNALQLNPQHLEARWRLGEAYLALKQPDAALIELTNAEPLIGQHPDLVLSLARAQIAVGKFNPALVTLSKYSGPHRPAEVDALVVQAKIGLGQHDEAKTILDKATQQDPGAASLQLATARLALSQNDLAGAKTAAMQAVEIAPKDAEAWLMRGRIAMLQHEGDEAENAFRKALEFSTTKTDAQAALAEALLTNGKADAATPIVADLTRSAPNSVAAEFLNSWLAYLRKDWAAAESRLLNVIKLAPKHPQALLMLADSQYHQDQFTQTEQTLKSFDALYPNQFVARRLLGAALLKQHKAHEATTLLAPLAKANANDPGLLSLLSYAYFASGEAKKGVEFLHQAEVLAPQSNAVQAQHALSELMSGNKDAGIASLEKLAAASPSESKPRELLAYAQLLTGNDKSALESAQALVELNPQDPTAQNLLGITKLRAGDSANAEMAFAAALQADPKYAPALTNQAMMLLAKKDETTARAKLSAALEANPAYTQASLLLAMLDERGGKLAEAGKRLEAAAKNSPQASQPRWLLASRALRSGQRDEALKWAQEAFAIEPNSPQSRLRWGDFQLASGANKAAYETLTALHHDEPTMPVATLLFARAAQANSKLAEARGAYQELLAAQPKSLEVLGGLFGLELSDKNFARAKELIQKIHDAAPNSPAATAAEAELAARQGDTANVVKLVRELHDKAPSTASVLRLASALAADHKAAEAQTLLSDWISVHSNDVPVRLQLGTLSLGSNDRPRAQKLFEEVLKAAPDNPVALNNLAWLYDEAGDERALDYAERAAKALPNSPQTTDTLGWILVRKTKVERGLQLLQQAMKDLPSDPNIAYHVAYGLAESGDKAQADGLLKRVLQEHPDFDSRKDAQALARRIDLKNSGDSPLRF